MNQQVKELLSDPFKGRSRAKGVLCYMFRDALVARRVNQFTWNKRLKAFMKKPHNKNLADTGNLNKNFSRDEFTWPKFKQAIDFLNPHKATFIVELVWRNGRESRYPIVLDFTEKEDHPALDDLEGKQTTDLFRDRAQPTTTLTRLFQRILIDEHIDVRRWNALVDAYVHNPESGVEQTRSDIQTEISSINKALFGASITWNNFRKGMLILNPQQVAYILELQWDVKGKDVTQHTAVFRDPLHAGDILASAPEKKPSQKKDRKE